MRSSTRKALTLGILGASALLWSGCEAEKQTQYVAGISTQVQVPRDLKTVRVDVTVGGIVTFCQAYRVFDGKVQLPRSLGTYPTDVSRLAAPVTISVVGFTSDFDESNPAMGSCTSTAPKVGDNGVRVLRRSRQPYLQDQTLFLPMGLKFGCYDTDCEGSPTEKTCKAGRCYDANVDPTTLKPFSPDLVDGTGGNCFHASECMAAAIPPAMVDPADCTYAIPNTPSAPAGLTPNPLSTPGEGLNVEVVFDGGAVAEILDQDEQEGFFIPDPAKPQQFRLAPGLCDMVKGEGPDPQNPETTRLTPHRVTAVRASALCRAKTPSQPLCSADAFARMGLDTAGSTSKLDFPNACKGRELSAAKSVLMILADDTERHRELYKDAELASLMVSLKDPAFSKTDVGLAYFPGAPDACAPRPPAKTPALARAVRDALIEDLKTHSLQGNVEPQLAGQLSAAYELLGADAYKGYYKRAVLVLGNRAFDAAACGPSAPATLAGIAKGGPSPVDTYVILLTSDTDPTAPDPLPGASALAFAGGPYIAYDARGGKKQNAFSAFQQITKDLATCVYDVETSGERPQAGDVLAYTDAIALPATASTPIPYDADCNSATATVSGWGYDASAPNRIRVCGAACEAYRGALASAQAYAGLYLQPAQAVPMFWFKGACAP